MISLCKLISIKIFILLIKDSVWLKLGTIFICNLKSFCKASLSPKNAVIVHKKVDQYMS